VADLFFETPQDWIEAVQAWAASEARITRVWVFGSRATGLRTPKEAPDLVPDLDLGFLVEPLPGEELGEAIAYAMFNKAWWTERLGTVIPVKVDLRLAQPKTDLRVWPAIKDRGVLIFQRD